MPGISHFNSSHRITLLDSYNSDVTPAVKFEVYPTIHRWYIPWSHQKMIRVPDDHENLMIVFSTGISSSGADTFYDMYSALIIPENDYSQDLFKKSIIYASNNILPGVFFTGPGYHLVSFIMFIGPRANEYQSGFMTDNENIYGPAAPLLGFEVSQYKTSNYTAVVALDANVPKIFYHTVQFGTYATPATLDLYPKCKIYSLA